MDAQNFLTSSLKEFRYYKSLGDKTLAQLPDEALFRHFDGEINSIAVIVQHLSGNMLSRWTDFLTTDGEKHWRNRDAEFEQIINSRGALMKNWNEGWDCLFGALASLTPDDLDTIVYIRNQGHTITEVIHRQISHYAYHVGQIVQLGKMFAGSNWQSLSIPRNESGTYNKELFQKEKERKHFTDSK